MDAAAPELDSFRLECRDWITARRGDAPPNYGAILPPELEAEGRAWQRLLSDAGLAGLHWPVEYGGRGLSAAHTAVWVEECAAADVPPFANMVGLVLAAGALLAFGTPEQRAELLPPTGRGEILWCQLFSEPGAGSDLAGLSTRAAPDGDEFVIDGQKVWCSGGRFSDWGILLARTDASLPKHRGISFFAVPMDLPGIEVRPLRQMTGGSEFDEVFLTGVRLPAHRLIGPLNGGWNVAMSVLTNERGHIGAGARSTQRAVDGLLDAARTAAPGAVERGRLLQLCGRGAATLWLAERVRQEPLLAGLLKPAVTELAVDVARLHTDLGGVAGLADPVATRPFLASPAGPIAGGTSEVQRNIIGERLLGLPKEP